MKKYATVWMLVTALVLTGCGERIEETSANVDLEAFYAAVAQEYQWGDGYMVDLEGEMLEASYPGLQEIPTVQRVAKAPVMSSVVNEMVFLECKSEEDADCAAAILQERITLQKNGGAWYPESMEAWGRGIVIRQGNYVAMIASAEHQDEISDGFTRLFQ